MLNNDRHVTTLLRAWMLRTLALLLALSFAVPGFAQEAAERFGDRSEPIFEAETLVLASFRLANGNEVRFVGVPADGLVLVGEITDAGPTEQFVIDPEMHPADVFLALAPADSPVPQLISRIDAESRFPGRPVVKALDRAHHVSSDILPTPLPQAAGSGSCASGQAGADFFEDNHCYTLGGPGYGSSEGYCYDGAWNSLQKTSSSKRRATWTIMASCGTATNKLRHYYKTASGYTTQLTVNANPQTIQKWWSNKGGIKRYRRVRMEEIGAGGWIRGWIKYHSEVAG